MKDRIITGRDKIIAAKDKIIAAEIEEIKAKDEEIRAHKDITTGLRAENSAIGAEVTRLNSVVTYTTSTRGSPALCPPAPASNNAPGKRKCDDSKGGSGLRALVDLNQSQKNARVKIKEEKAEAEMGKADAEDDRGEAQDLSSSLTFHSDKLMSRINALKELAKKAGIDEAGIRSLMEI